MRGSIFDKRRDRWQCVMAPETYDNLGAYRHSL